MFLNVIKLNKIHEIIINKSIENCILIKTYIINMINFISIISLMQICEHLIFINKESLINILCMKHVKITVQLSSQYDKFINESIIEHKRSMK
jgi:hypothetical protein